MSKRILFFILFSWVAAASPASAREEADSTHTFRFVPREDMFYVPYEDNERELARLLAYIETHKADILAGKLPLHVDGWCNSLDSEKENLRVAAIRSNRVKSELIARGGIKEACFVTKNHASGGDFVTVRLTVPASAAPAVETEARREAEEERRAAEKAETDRLAAEQAARRAGQQEHAADTPAESQPSATSHLALHANLLRWATLTPDLGLEWRVHPSWGILVNGSWTSWSWNDKDRRYALWEVAPEVRHYMGKEKRGHLGAMFKAGGFNHKLSATGKQGDLVGGGVTGGYLLRLNDALSLDLSLAIGYLNADYEKYEVVDGVRVRRSSETKNWWGPVNAGVTLVWKLF